MGAPGTVSPDGVLAACPTLPFLNRRAGSLGRRSTELVAGDGARPGEWDAREGTLAWMSNVGGGGLRSLTGWTPRGGGPEDAISLGGL